MEVEFNTGLTVSNPVSQSPIRRQPAESAANTMSFDYTQALEQTLKETPSVRPEAVNRAASLLADPGYPSDEVLNRVAALLAKNMQSQSA